MDVPWENLGKHFLESALFVKNAIDNGFRLTPFTFQRKYGVYYDYIHPSELNIETGEDHATMLYYGTAVNDDRPMSRAEITNSAIHTIRQQMRTDAPRRHSSNSHTATSTGGALNKTSSVPSMSTTSNSTPKKRSC